MNPLTEFLLARIAEDEAVAEETRPDESADSDGALEMWCADAGEFAFVAVTSARVRAECEAKRQIVGRHAESAAFGCGICSEYRREHVETCDEMRMLAMVYADHADYREEWRP